MAIRGVTRKFNSEAAFKPCHSRAYSAGIQCLSNYVLVITALLALAMFVSAAPACAEGSTADQVLQKIFDSFHTQKLRSMVYDEVRTVSTKLNSPGADQGMMSLDKKNATIYIMRNYYRAPDQHGYRMVTKPIEGFWPGSPNQTSAILMDERWIEKVRENYKLSLSADKVVRGEQCYVLSLVPKRPNEYNFPMTWYVEKRNFSIIKFIHLIKRNTGMSVSTTGEIFYGTQKGHYVPTRAQWITHASNVMYDFDYKIEYKNYMFNVPMDDSVFKAQPVPPPAHH